MGTHIGGNIRYLRRRLGISQERLAKELGWNRGNIASYEGGKAVPGAERLVRLATYFEVEVADIVHKNMNEETDRVWYDELDPGEYIRRAASATEGLRSLAEGYEKYYGSRPASSGSGKVIPVYPEEDINRLLALLKESICNQEELLYYVERIMEQDSENQRRARKAQATRRKSG